jgi:hypothetical protein
VTFPVALETEIPVPAILLKTPVLFTVNEATGPEVVAGVIVMPGPAVPVTDSTTGFPFEVTVPVDVTEAKVGVADVDIACGNEITPAATLMFAPILTTPKLVVEVIGLRYDIFIFL